MNEIDPNNNSPGAHASSSASAKSANRAKLGARWPLWIATAGGLGYAPVAPGTAGSAGGVLVFWLLTGLSLPLYALTLAALAALGIWASDWAERYFDSHDDGRIVIDEVAGQLVTFTPLVVWPPVSGRAFFVLLVTGFVAFRVFDVWKPGPVGWAQDHFAGGTGVMADDLLAGVLAAGVVWLCSLLLGAAL